MWKLMKFQHFYTHTKTSKSEASIRHQCGIETKCQTSYFQNYNECVFVIYMIISLKHFWWTKMQFAYQTQTHIYWVFSILIKPHKYSEMSNLLSHENKWLSKFILLKKLMLFSLSLFKCKVKFTQVHTFCSQFES